MIQVKNLTKKYGPNTAVDNISFDIEDGKIYGLLGPNGAGKSTTMNIITGCLAASAGSVTVAGFDIVNNPIEAKRHIGYLPEIPPLYTDMTTLEYLTFVAEAKQVDYEALYRQVKEVIELTNLADVKDKLIRSLSKGYRQRVGIAQAMLGNPDIIILDEPTVGLDPKQIIEIRDLIRRLGQSKTVILSSHILSEVAEVCEHLIIIDHGKIVANDTLQNLNSEESESEILRISVRGEREIIESVLNDIECIISREELLSHESGIVEYRLTVARGEDTRDTIFFAMADAHCAVIVMEREASSLESIFLRLTSAEDKKYDFEQYGDEPDIEDEAYGEEYQDDHQKDNEEDEA